MDVLVIEDDPSIAELLAALLGEEGHAVTGAAGPSSGLALAHARSWDACLTDGFWLVETAAARAYLADLTACCPVVLLSGQPWARSRPAADLGLAALVAKPFDLDDVVAALAAAATGPGRGSPTDPVEPPAST